MLRFFWNGELELSLFVKHLIKRFFMMVNLDIRQIIQKRLVSLSNIPVAAFSVELVVSLHFKALRSDGHD